MANTAPLNTFSLAGMLLRLYSFFVLMWDFNAFIFYTIFSIFCVILEVFLPKQQKPVDKEVVLIVGAGEGVGRELALQLGDLGACVVCWDKNPTTNEDTMNCIRARIGQAYGYTCDVTDRQAVLRTGDKVKKEVGDVTMMFNCASVLSARALVSPQPIDVQATVDLGILSHFWLLEAFYPRMKELDHGHIVTLTSVAGFTGISNQVALSVSQFAAQGLVESMLERTRHRNSKNMHFTLAHIYPFILSDELADDIRLRIPSFFGKIDSKKAASKIIQGVRRNHVEVSIPGFLLYLGHVLKLLPRNSTAMLKDMLNTGTDFA